MYEIFYIRLIQEKAVDYLNEEKDFVDEVIEVVNKINVVNNSEKKQFAELIYEIQGTVRDLEARMNVKVQENHYKIEVYQLMLIEFGISFEAMCYLLMIFEAMQVCNYEMKGLKHLSLEIGKKLSYIYDRELAMLIKSNRKRATRYRAVNKRIEQLLEYQFPKYEEYDVADVIYTFMVELCKPRGQQNQKILRGLEVMLGYPIYYERKGSDT